MPQVTTATTNPPSYFNAPSHKFLPIQRNLGIKFAEITDRVCWLDEVPFKALTLVCKDSILWQSLEQHFSSAAKSAPLWSSERTWSFLPLDYVGNTLPEVEQDKAVKNNGRTWQFLWWLNVSRIMWRIMMMIQRLAFHMAKIMVGNYERRGSWRYHSSDIINDGKGAEATVVIITYSYHEL